MYIAMQMQAMPNTYATYFADVDADLDGISDFTISYLPDKNRNPAYIHDIGICDSKTEGTYITQGNCRDFAYGNSKLDKIIELEIPFDKLPVKIKNNYNIRFRIYDNKNQKDVAITTFSSTGLPTSVITASTDQKNITNSIGMEFVQIPAGEFDMGSATDEKYTVSGVVYPVHRFDNEGPVHRVKISKNFYIGKYEVTQKQWVEVMGGNPSDFKGNDLPVVQVSWNDVQDFIIKLNQKEGTTKYRLPSEAEWEYAARAGTNTIWYFGNDATNLEEYIVGAGDRTARPGAPCVAQQVCPTARPVGQKKPNQWGLYDMIGNVYEWVQDKYHINYNGAPSDGSAWESGNDPDLHIIKGGSWGNGVEVLRPAFRSGLFTNVRGNSNGFRLVKNL